MEWQVIIVLFGSFFFFLGLGVPISFAIGVCLAIYCDAAATF